MRYKSNYLPKHLNIFHLRPLTSTLCRMMIGILQQSAGVGSQSTTPCQPISQTSAMVLQLWQMWPLGENVKYLTPRWQLVRKRNLQANLQQQQHFKQMFQSIFLLLQKVRKLESFMTPLYPNADHTSVSQSRYPWTPIRRRRKSSEPTSSSITHHSGMILFTQ